MLCVVCCVFFLLAIVVSTFVRYTASGYHLGIFKRFLSMCIVMFNNINIQPRPLPATIFDRYENYVLRTITTVGNVEYQNKQ